MEFNNYFTTPDNFSLFNLNIRCLHKKYCQSTTFLEGLNIIFTVLSFTETGFTENKIYLNNFT